MKKLIFICLITICNVPFVSAQRPIAFPGAEGFGKFASGGRNGELYRVTNLNDSGEGSFRDAVSKPNRTIIFDVGGVIRIAEPLVFAENLTIAGQTAPGKGITVYGNNVSFSKANNIICRYIRFRMGIDGRKGGDAVGIAAGHNMIFDHVSVSWGKDENFSVSSMKVVGGPSNITVQNSIIGQGLATHSMAGLIQSDGGITLYRNLYINNRSRNVKAKGINQFVNNVIYNWSVAAYILGGGSQFPSFCNITGNYFIYGPETRSKPFTRGNENFALYAGGNYADDNKNGVLDGRLLEKADYDVVTWMEEPFDYPEIPEMNATAAYHWIRENAGCTFPARDEADKYMIGELESNGTKGKIIESEKGLPIGFPDEKAYHTDRVDTDGDGIPDEWETANGLNPNDPKDARGFGLSRHYTNIELYLNSLVQ